MWARAGKGWGGVVGVWGDGRAAQRGKLDGRGRKCEGRAEAHERGAEGAGLGGRGGEGSGCALGGDEHAFLFETAFLLILHTMQLGVTSRVL